MYRLAVIILLATTVVVAHMPRVATRKKNKDRDEDRLLQQDEESGLRGSNPVYDGQNRRLVGEDDEDDNFDDAAFSADADDERRAASLSSTLGDFDDLAVLLASTIGAGITSTKVAIGGAGAAGVGAATTLDANNVDFIIFEAANRVGGRVFPFRFGKEGRRVTNEAGAQVRFTRTIHQHELYSPLSHVSLPYFAVDQWLDGRCLGLGQSSLWP